MSGTKKERKERVKNANKERVCKGGDEDKMLNILKKGKPTPSITLCSM